MGIFDWLRGGSTKTKLEKWLEPVTLDSIALYFEGNLDADGLEMSSALLMLHSSKSFVRGLHQNKMLGQGPDCLQANVAVFEAVIFLATVSLDPVIKYAVDELGLGFTKPVNTLPQMVKEMADLDGLIDPLADALLHMRGRAAAIISLHWPEASEDCLSESIESRKYNGGLAENTEEFVGWLRAGMGHDLPAMQRHPGVDIDIMRAPLQACAQLFANKMLPAAAETMRRQIALLAKMR